MYKQTPCGMNSMRLIFKTEILINHSEVNLDLEILFGKIIHQVDAELRKMLLKKFVFE